MSTGVQQTAAAGPRIALDEGEGEGENENENDVDWPPVLSKPDAKVAAVVNHKKDFIDDLVENLSRKIISLEEQGAFAVQQVRRSMSLNAELKLRRLFAEFPFFANEDAFVRN